MSSGPVVREPRPEDERVRALPLVGIAVGSLIAGFLIVYSLGRSAAEAPTDRPARPAPAPAPAPVPVPVPASVPAPAPSRAAVDAGATSPPAADAAVAAAPPAAATPPVPAASARGSTVGAAYYFRCWAAGSDEPTESADCDRLPELERRLAAQVSEIEACASGVTGTLSLGIEVQLRARQASYWAGRSSTIEPVDPLIRCVRTRLADTDLAGIEGQYRKYTLFLPIELR